MIDSSFVATFTPPPRPVWILALTILNAVLLTAGSFAIGLAVARRERWWTVGIGTLGSLIAVCVRLIQWWR